MVSATNSFDTSSVVGQGGYGKVYKGILADGTLVAIKRAQEGSLQGQKEFLTEIELLSRVHHRNLVSLLGYCDEEDEQVLLPHFSKGTVSYNSRLSLDNYFALCFGMQMLVYEFMSNGTLRDHLSGN